MLVDLDYQQNVRIFREEPYVCGFFSFEIHLNAPQSCGCLPSLIVFADVCYPFTKACYVASPPNLKLAIDKFGHFQAYNSTQFN